MAQKRVNRVGEEQILLGVWVDKSLYASLEAVARPRRLTVSDITRELLARGIAAENDRPDALVLIELLLSLSDAERSLILAKLKHEFAAYKSGCK